MPDICVQQCVVDSTDGNYSTVKYDWYKADLCTYKKAVQNNLASVNIPQCLLGCNRLCIRADHLCAIDEYYASIIACIKQCTDACVPTVNSYVTKHNVPDWTDLVKDKHAVARAVAPLWLPVTIFSARVYFVFSVGYSMQLCLSFYIFVRITL